MHAAVEPPEITGRVGQSCKWIPAGERIEYSNLEIGMAIQSQHPPILTGCQEVIDQQAHAEAAVSRVKQLVEEEQSHRVSFDEIALGVDGAFGPVGQGHANGHGFNAVRQQEEPGFSGLLARKTGNLLTQPGVPGVRRSEGRCLRRIEIHRGAARRREQHEAQEHARQSWWNQIPLRSAHMRNALGEQISSS